MAKVRPNGSAEPSVEMAEPFGFGRTTFLAVRSYTNSFLKTFMYIAHEMKSGKPHLFLGSGLWFCKKYQKGEITACT